jgi:hypothetical protein
MVGASGKYELSILLCGERIQGSPFKVSARMPAAVPHLCTASGAGLRTARAGALSLSLSLTLSLTLP